MMMGDNNISTEYTKVPSDRLVYTQPSKSSYPKRSSNWRNGLYDILDLVEESNQLGDDNGFGVFWANRGLNVLMNAVKQQHDIIEHFQIIDEKAKGYSIEEFLDKIKSLKVRVQE